MPEVPEHWDIVRLKWVLRKGEGIKIGPFGSSLKLQDLDDNGIRVYGQENVIKDDFTLGKRFLSKEKFEELSVYEVFPKDILVTMMGTTGKCKLVPEDAEKGIMDSHLIRLRANEKMKPEFLSILINDSLQLKFQMSIDSKGSIMSGLNSKIVKNLFLPLPPIEEQNRIVEILNTESAKITRFIQTKQRFIELLKEQRQSIITNAVTKGIDDGVKMKETALGEIPEHWKHTAIKRLVKTKITDGPHETPKMVNEGIPFVSAEAAVNGKIELSRMRCYISPKLHEEYCKKVRPTKGDIFMVKSGSTTGKVVIVDFDDEFSIWSPLALVRPLDSIDNEFLFYAMSSNYFQREVQLNWSFGTQPNIGMAKMEQLNVAFPPTIEEQKRIVEHIKTETRTLDIAISKAEREIELIKEYREAMIAEAVTGKMKL